MRKARAKWWYKAILFALIGTLGSPPAACGVSEVRRTPVVEVVERVLPGVVNISTEKIIQVRYTDPLYQLRRDLFDDFFREFFGPIWEGYERRFSLGSGVIIDPDGYILTNFHVVERASRIRVTLADRSEYEAVVLASDPISDLALIKVTPTRPLTALELAEEDDVMLGETVIVLGNPFGLEHTVTVGVVSARDREARYRGQVIFHDILQTDAAVNPGSSGGPMVNLDGKVIGINVAIYREAQNIGFAVPVKRVKEVLGYWLAPLFIRNLTPGFEVEEKSPGELVVAFLHPRHELPVPVAVGDRIQTVQGRATRSLFDYHRALLGIAEGEPFEIGVEREGRSTNYTLRLSRPAQPSGELLAKQRLGLEFSPAPLYWPKGGSAVVRGLLVRHVDENSRAAAAGLKPGMVVTRINQREIRSLDDVGWALQRVRSGDPVEVAWSRIEESDAWIIVHQAAAIITAM